MTGELKFSIEKNDDGSRMFCACLYAETGDVLCGWSADAPADLLALIQASMERS